MTVYLDVCALSRPYDDQSQLRIRMETNAVLLITDAIQNSLYQLLSSPVHFIEIRSIEDDRERVEIESFLLHYSRNISCDTSVVRERADFFHARGIGLADAAHLAFADVGSDFMISCDDRFVKRARKIKLDCVVLTPLEFYEKELRK